MSVSVFADQPLFGMLTNQAAEGSLVVEKVYVGYSKISQGTEQQGVQRSKSAEWQND